MSSEQETGGNEALYILLGTLATALVSGISWLCVKKCKNQSCTVNSGCIKFHSDSDELRNTMREVAAEEIQRSKDVESQLATD